MLRWPVYLGTFLIAMATLALEVTLTRLLSVTSWYHLSFFAVSTAMLGMTAGATTVYLRGAWFEPDRLGRSIARSCMGFALAVPFTLVMLCLLPLHIQPGLVTMGSLSLLMTTLMCSLPFYFSGIAVTAVLTKASLPIGRLYAVDLLGASLGCLVVLGGLEVLDAPSLILVCGAAGVAAAACFAAPAPAGAKAIRWAALAVLAGLAAINVTASHPIRPLALKGQLENPRLLTCERWNSFSRVSVSLPWQGPPQYWGPSPKAPQTPTTQYEMVIDGCAGTVMRKFETPADLEHLRWDVTNVAYHLRPTGGACVIGAGAGRDVQAAVLFGHQRVLGLEINPIFVDFHRGRFRDFSGIAACGAVELKVDEARSYLSWIDERFRVVQMSLIDTFAATGAGAFTLSENSLYTVEAWETFCRRLGEDGIFTVSRWYDPRNLNEAGRALTLAVEAHLRSGGRQPGRHIALVTVDKVATLLLSKSPFSDADVAALKRLAGEMEFELPVLPGERSSNELFARILACESVDELHRSITDTALNYEPPTDENPYFFNMLRLSHLGEAFRSHGGVLEGGVISGNLHATVILLVLIACLALLAVVTIILPLLIGQRLRAQRERAGAVLWSGAIYFCLIGAGFMACEIAMIQRLVVFLGHPVYALGILLFTIIAATGVGSFLSDRLPLTRRRWALLMPVVTAGAILATRFALTAVISAMLTQPPLVKIAVTVAMLFPMGMLMGLFFPTGMRLLRDSAGSETPWYWALNGVLGVLFSAIAVFVSIYLTLSTNFYIAAACYLLLVPCLARIIRASNAGIPACD